METLPSDIQWLIWRTYYSKFVLDSLMNGFDFVWRKPSDRLIELCKDVGTIQQGHMEIHEMIEDHNMWCWETCVGSNCANCEIYGFPCTNLAIHGFNNERLDRLWKPNFI